MSIVRVGLSENQKFADGYDAIFGKKKAAKKVAKKAKALGSKKRGKKK